MIAGGTDKHVEKEQLFNTFFQRLHMHHELKVRAQAKADAEVVPSAQTQSDIHFKALMVDDFERYQTPE